LPQIQYLDAADINGVEFDESSVSDEDDGEDMWDSEDSYSTDEDLEDDDLDASITPKILEPSKANVS